MSKKIWVFSGVFGVCLLVDQATKWWVVQNLEVGVDEVSIIPGFFSFVHAQNHGAAFSALEGQWAIFMVFTAVATVVVLDLLRRLRPDATMVAAVLGMILSGAIGNGIDRIRQRYVTDFLRVYTESPGPKEWLIENFGTNTWPIFNVADSVLLVGVALFLVHYLFLEESEPEDEDDLETAEFGPDDVTEQAS